MVQRNLFGGDTTVKPSILISLQAQYWQLIVDGKKKYEYRRTFRNDAVTAFVFVTSPSSAAVGVLELDTPIIAPVPEVCQIAEEQSPGSTKGMMDYMAGLENGYAVPILSHEVFSASLSIQEIRAVIPRFHPPQSYLVLANYPELRKLLQERRGRSGSQSL